MHRAPTAPTSRDDGSDRVVVEAIFTALTASSSFVSRELTGPSDAPERATDPGRRRRGWLGRR